MVVTWLNLIGARENLDKTIDALLKDSWDDTNTSSITPDFENDTNQPDHLATDDDTGANKVYSRLSGREQLPNDENIPNGDSIHRFLIRIIIDVYAESLPLLGLFEDEVNRILWENRPDSSTRLNKSDLTNASEAALFDMSELQFERIEPPEDAIDETPSSQGELQIWVYRGKT